MNAKEIAQKAKELRPSPMANDGLRPSQIAAEAARHFKVANDILEMTFGSIRNERLPDMLVYFPSEGATNTYSDPYIVMVHDGQDEKGNKERNVLYQKASIEAVVFTEGAKCTPASVRLTVIGGTQPTASLGLDKILESLITRKDLENTETAVKPVTIETESVGELDKDTQLCFGMQRLLLPSASADIRFTAEWRPKIPEKTSVCQQGKPTEGKQEQDTDRCEGPSVCCCCQPGKTSTGKPAGGDPVVDVRRAVKNFANLRRPLHWGSVGIGTPVYTLRDNQWCTNAGGCRPNLYVFGHIYSARFPLDDNEHPTPTWSAAGVVGLRVLDPVLGAAVAGIRLGAEEGLSKGLSRFGVILGVSYNFRSFSNDTTQAVQTSQTLADGSVVQTTTTTHVSQPQGNKFSLFGALDFAF